MNLQKEWFLEELLQSEQDMKHTPMETEYRFYRAVCMGDLEYVQENCRQNSFADPKGMGILSKNLLRNIKYHFVVTAALITRNCIMAGMAQEKAYRMSDFYIAKMDECLRVEDVVTLHHHMVMEFTEYMHHQQLQNRSSEITVRCIDFIYSHLQERITIEMLAEQTGTSPSHLSRLFKADTGVSVSDYIRKKKIEQAQNLLRYSDYSYVEIANYLAFSSQSHFIQVFEHFVGLTPKKYRDRYYKKEW